MKVYKDMPKDEWEQLCARPAIKSDDLEALCEEVFDAVQKDGDKAVLSYTKKFDSVELESLVMSAATIDELARKISTQLKNAVDMAYENIKKFHKSQKLQPKQIETTDGVMCWQESRPVEKVGIYVPGGSAPLISTVLMLGVPAQLAGCKEVVLCTPPNKDGLINSAICYAAQKVGVTKIAMVGGIQAIAALTCGTKSVPKVEKIFGPGNQYVTAAKQYAMKYGVAIDIPAGPSEVMVVADDSAEPSFVAADLLSQAEHGPDSQVVLVTTNVTIFEKVRQELSTQLNRLPRKDIAEAALNNSFCIVLSDLNDCIDFANTYAPEHLILSINDSEALAKKVNNAGSVFLGNYSPESAGDYASGTNHTLPTGGWAKSYGGVSLDSFIKKVTFQQLTKSGLEKLGPAIEELARAEGLQAHARAVTIRTNAK